VLFSNLDEMSNKGLIKGLIMLSHIQEKKLKAHDSIVSKIKDDCNRKLRDKDRTIKKLSDELGTLKDSLKGCKYYLIVYTFSN
jgi:hypothetical protein